MKPLTVGSLFAGIGGFDLGFERAGFEIKWQVEIDAYATKVLTKHWPGVTRYGDIRGIDWAHVEPVDVVCGGFPCQPHSTAGRRLASADERDLWDEFAGVIRALRPRWVVAENVPGLLSSESGRFFGRVLRDLAACGYDAEWDCLPAIAFGAPHRRDRVWIVAYADHDRRHNEGHWAPRHEGASCGAVGALCESGSLADATVGRVEGQRIPTEAGRCLVDLGRCGQDLADTHGDEQWRRTCDEQMGRLWCACAVTKDSATLGVEWRVEPNVGRVAHGVPARVDRLKGLGNAVVPQITEWIARQIKKAEDIKD